MPVLVDMPGGQGVGLPRTLPAVRVRVGSVGSRVAVDMPPGRLVAMPAVPALASGCLPVPSGPSAVALPPTLALLMLLLRATPPTPRSLSPRSRCAPDGFP